MSRIIAHANQVSKDFFGDLEEGEAAQNLSAVMPLMATPAAVAAGAGIGVTAFGAGFAVGLAND
ncbi:MAG: hypothetical protein ACRDZO_21315 [Egibacteraceae bacterium]